MLGAAAPLIGGIVFLAVRLESRRLRSGMEAFAQHLTHGQVIAERGPGAWRWTRVEGEISGCQVSLRPRTYSAGHVNVGSATPLRMRAVGVELVVRGPSTGNDQPAPEAGLPARSGEAGPPQLPEALGPAAKACKASVALEKGMARAALDPPKGVERSQRVAQLAEALADYLSQA